MKLAKNQYFKLCRPDGFDVHSGTINYRGAVGGTVTLTKDGPLDLARRV